MQLEYQNSVDRRPVRRYQRTRFRWPVSSPQSKAAVARENENVFGLCLNTSRVRQFYLDD